MNVTQIMKKLYSVTDTNRESEAATAFQDVITSTLNGEGDGPFSQPNEGTISDNETFIDVTFTSPNGPDDGLFFADKSTTDKAIFGDNSTSNKGFIASNTSGEAYFASYITTGEAFIGSNTTDEAYFASNPTTNEAYFASNTTTDGAYFASNTTTNEAYFVSNTTTETFIQNDIAKYIYQYLPPFLIILGTLGNVCSIATFRRPALRTKSTSVYFITLAISDTTALVSGLLRWWIIYTFSLDIRDMYDIICKLQLFLVYFSLSWSAWLLVSVTIERLIIVSFPLRAKELCNKQKAGVAIFIVTFFLVALNLHWFFTYGLKEAHNSTGPGLSDVVSGACDPLGQMAYEFTWVIFPWIDMAVTALVPFAIMIACNLVIIYKVKLANAWKSKQLSVNSPSNRTKLSSMTAMLLTSNCVFILLNCPVQVYLLNPQWFYYTGREGALMGLLWAVVSMLQYSNNGINFFLYCISGSKFRKEFMSLLRKKTPAFDRDVTLKTKETSIATPELSRSQSSFIDSVLPSKKTSMTSVVVATVNEFGISSEGTYSPH